MADQNFIKIAVADDHQLFRTGLIQLIESLDPKFKIVHQVSDGIGLKTALMNDPVIDIAIVDINMPNMNGFQTAEMLRSEHPDIKVLILTMNEDELSLVKMLKLGVRGYISKDIEPEELNMALNDIVVKGYYYNDELTKHLINVVKNPEGHSKNGNNLSSQELKFIALACSEDTYEKIADTMCLSPKTIDGYRA
ncbi:MAG: response regulator transcription factor, partial [Crocinitomicaceae bacterium]